MHLMQSISIVLITKHDTLHITKKRTNVLLEGPLHTKKFQWTIHKISTYYLPLHLRHKIHFHSQKYKFIHTLLRHWLDNDDVRFVNMKKKIMIKVGQSQNKKKTQIFISDTFFQAIFLGLRVGNYMWKWCHLINKDFVFKLHIFL